MDDWTALLAKLDKHAGVQLNELTGVLLLIGVQELGQGIRKFSKQEKLDLMHVGLCKILSHAGYYQFEGLDEDGWPHWKLLKKVPKYEKQNQEEFIKSHIIFYFKKIKFL